MVWIHPKADTEEDADEGALDANDGRSSGVEVGTVRASLRQHGRGPNRSGRNSPEAEANEGKERDGTDDVTTGHDVSSRFRVEGGASDGSLGSPKGAQVHRGKLPGHW